MTPCKAVVLAFLAFALRASGAPPWVPDRGDGTYQNPVLFADYSDPDAVRVGGDFYLVASSFECAPGLPILHSRDLVNWTLIGHVFAEQAPRDRYASPQHGDGAWAPAIRFHEGRFWIYYPDPDFGIYVSTATDPAGPWSPPRLVLAGRGVIDPCPFWDADGTGYLIHAWARSRAGFANRLTLRRLSSDGYSAVGPGETVVDADRLPGWRTLEGPKLYRRLGWYYIFAPAGGVVGGYQAVFRSKSIHGPYEARIVLDQGRTAVNGPHQGAWVDTPGGQDWFLHFQDRGAFGRVVHLEPMMWRPDGWPVIGADPENTGKGEPVAWFRKPDVAGAVATEVPATSDEFRAEVPGLQWQWESNPRPEWAAPAPGNGGLRLACAPPGTGGNLWSSGNLLLQKFAGPAFTATTVVRFAPANVGDEAGLIVFGSDYAWIGIRRDAGGPRLHFAERRNAAKDVPERDEAAAEPPAGAVTLRVAVDAGARCRFSWSADGESFAPVGGEFTAVPGRWMGAKVGIFASSSAPHGAPGHADFGWFRVTAPAP